MVYLLHFDQPISPHHTCQHYIGYCRSLRQRLKTHRENPDARLLQIAKQRGIGFTVARTWKGGRDLERQLKKRKNAGRLCPFCMERKRKVKASCVS